MVATQTSVQQELLPSTPRRWEHRGTERWTNSSQDMWVANADPGSVMVHTSVCVAKTCSLVCLPDQTVVLSYLWLYLQHPALCLARSRCSINSHWLKEGVLDMLETSRPAWGQEVGANDLFPTLAIFGLAFMMQVISLKRINQGEVRQSS